MILHLNKIIKLEQAFKQVAELIEMISNSFTSMKHLRINYVTFKLLFEQNFASLASSE